MGEVWCEQRQASIPAGHQRRRRRCRRRWRPLCRSWSMIPSARARAAGAPVEVDISKVEPGMMIRAEWRGQPIFVVHRTPEMLEDVEDGSPESRTPIPTHRFSPTTPRTNIARSSRSIWCWSASVLTSAVLPPASWRPARKAAWERTGSGGFFCPCHGSKFDLAGRVFKDVPAPTNLKVPPYTYLSDTRLLIGDDKGASSMSKAQALLDLDRRALSAHGDSGRAHVVRVLRAEEFQLLVLLRLAARCWCW